MKLFGLGLVTLAGLSTSLHVAENGGNHEAQVGFGHDCLSGLSRARLVFSNRKQSLKPQRSRCFSQEMVENKTELFGTFIFECF